MIRSRRFNLALVSLLIIVFSGQAFAKQAKTKSNSKAFYRLIEKRLAAKKKKQIAVKKDESLYYPISELTSNFASWGIDPKNKNSSINLKAAWEKFSKKKDIVVAVVDTGIEYGHPFLKDNLHVVNGTLSPKNYGVDFSIKSKINPRPNDSHGHGTHVAGIVKSVFPDVKLLALKYYNPQAPSKDNVDATIKALRYAVDMNVDIINYSGGGPEPAAEELRILREAEKKGILVIAAAGNEESNIDVRKNAYYPASYGLSNIITVTAHNQFAKILSSSNWGKRGVDISAPGYRIKSSLPYSRAGYLTGTSQATAFVTGVAAMIKSKYPNLSASEIKATIKQSAIKEKQLAAKCSSGGRLDANGALELAARFYSSKSQRAIANNSRKRNESESLKLAN